MKDFGYTADEMNKAARATAKAANMAELPRERAVLTDDPPTDYDRHAAELDAAHEQAVAEIPEQIEREISGIIEEYAALDMLVEALEKLLVDPRLREMDRRARDVTESRIKAATGLARGLYGFQVYEQ